VFFALAAEDRFRRAVLTDRNPDLIDALCGVRDEVDRVIGLLEDYRDRHSQETYYRVRDVDPAALDRASARPGSST